MRLAEKHFWRSIPKASRHGGNLLLGTVEKLCDSEIGNYNGRVGVACLVENVLWLEVTVRDIVFVEVCRSDEDLAGTLVLCRDARGLALWAPARLTGCTLSRRLL